MAVQYLQICAEKLKYFFMKKTISFSATLGINPGYGHSNQKVSATEIVGKVWQEAAAEEMNQNGGTYVGAVIVDSKTVYHTDWGCPKGGEKTALITGECNPEYTSIEDYKSAVVSTLERCAKKLEQSTTQVRFAEVELAYLDFRPKEEEGSEASK